MDNTETQKSSKVLLWIVGIVALVWNGMLCMNLFEQMSSAGIATLPEEY